MSLLALSGALLPTALTPPSPLSLLSSIERASFSLDREREGIVRRLKQQLSPDGDELDQLSLSDYALPAGCAVAITGANAGIGLESAVFLAEAGYAPIVCARTDAKAEQTVEAIKARVGPDAAVAGVTLDLSCFESAEAGGEAIVAAADSLGVPLRGLLLNAGVWPTEKRVTRDGLQEGLQVCHVSHQQLAQALLPTLCDGEMPQGRESRIVTVSSSAHALTDSVNTDDPAWEARAWDSSTAYGESKLANQLMAQELARRAPSRALTSLAVHPGVIPGTELFREFLPPAPTAGFGYPLPMTGPAFDAALRRFGDAVTSSPPARLAFKDAKAGSRTSLYALLAPGLPNGAYLSDLAVTDVAPAAKDARAREALWAWTESWLEAQRARRAATAAVVDEAPPAPIEADDTDGASPSAPTAEAESEEEDADAREETATEQPAPDDPTTDEVS